MTSADIGDVLTIDLAGETTEVRSGGSLTLGRDAGFVIDDNPYLHRTLAKVYDGGERWWIGNIGSKIAFDLYDRSSGSKVTIPPGSSAPLPGKDTLLSFRAGSSRYEIELRSTRAIPAVTIAKPIDTISQGDVAFTPGQLRLILALAEPSLLAPHEGLSIPASKEAAARLGWSMTTFNGKLENVCDKLAKTGVRGLKATRDDAAKNRRFRLVEHCLSVGIVTPLHLHLLDGDDR